MAFNWNISCEEDSFCSHVSDSPYSTENYFHGQIIETEELTEEAEE